MRRKQDWPERMETFFHSAQGRAFAWDGWNCALWALAHVDAITGSDLYAPFAAQCEDKESAIAVIEGMGGMEEAATSLFGNPLPTWRKAQRGDVVLFETEEEFAFGVVDLAGTHFAALTEKDGLIRLKLERAVLAWRI